MFVLHFISSLTRGGRERQLATIVAHADQQIMPSKIVFLNKRNNSYVSEYKLEDYCLQIEAKGKWARLQELCRIIKREKPDVVYAWGNGEAMSLLLLKPFLSFSLVNGSVRHGIRSRTFSHYLRTLVLHLSQHIVANSKAGLRANNLRRGHVLYNGVDEKFIRLLPDLSSKRVQLTGVPVAVPLLISVANLVPYKDYFSVLQALYEVKRAGVDFYYIILGEGPLRDEIIQKIQALGLADKVQLLGNVENVADYLKVSDLFIHSSKGEGCSNAILEAMAAGLPIIASDTGGTSEIVLSENGMLFPYKEVGALKNALFELLRDERKRKQMGKFSSAQIEEKFSVKAMMENYVGIIRNISKS